VLDNLDRGWNFGAVIDLNLYLSRGLRKKEESVLGLLISDEEENELSSERDMQIIEKQLTGFISGNSIKFPIIVDRDGVFNDLNSDSSGTALILFDIQKKTVKKYKFPLTEEQLNEISGEKDK
jgi:hypothetical protein